MTDLVNVLSLDEGDEFEYDNQPGRKYRVTGKAQTDIGALCYAGQCAPFSCHFVGGSMVRVTKRASDATNTKPKRSLPSRTAEEVYAVLKLYGGCWLTNLGEFGTVSKILMLQKKLDGKSSVTLRDLLKLTSEGYLTFDEFDWICKKGEFVPPTFKGSTRSMSDIEAWESPPKPTLGELPNGKVRFTGHSYSDRIYVKVGVGNTRIVTPTNEVYLVNQDNMLFLEDANSTNFEEVKE